MQQPKGFVLFQRDEAAFGIFLVQKGSISLRLESEPGKIILDRAVTRGSIIGLPATLAGGRYSLTAVTREESEVAFVGRNVLIQMVKADPALGLELMRALGDEVLQMRATLVSLPRNPGRHRAPAPKPPENRRPANRVLAHSKG